VAIYVLRPAVVAVLSAVLVLGAGGAIVDDDPTAEATMSTAGPPAAPAGTGSTASTVGMGSTVGSVGPVGTVTEPVSDSPNSTSGGVPAPAGVNPSVGALFADGGHFCTASVVHSPEGNVVLTAAHCVDDGSNRTGLSFAPGYHDGIAPYGMWTVDSVAVPSGWSSSQDQDLDFAFLTVSRAGYPDSLESLTGANQLGIDQGFTNQVTLTGYPDTSNSPVVCRNGITRSDTYQMRIACAGFPDGTSGGPWVVDASPSTGFGTVIGVIGGYQLGGDSPDVSYSAYFDDDIGQLYRSVTS
jgi:V8-like Glu-specific endopeptidase